MVGFLAGKNQSYETQCLYSVVMPLSVYLFEIWEFKYGNTMAFNSMLGNKPFLTNLSF